MPKRWQPVIDDFAKYTKWKCARWFHQLQRHPGRLKSNTIQVAWLSSKIALEAVEDNQSTILRRW